MIVLKTVGIGTLGTIAAMVLGIIMLVPIVASSESAGAGAAAGVIAIDPSQDALTDIPPLLLPIYITAAETCPGLPWTVIGAVGKIESNHGRFGGAEIDALGNVRPKIIGIALDGTNNTRAIPDTENGALDNDITWDRAVGPFQFIPTSWSIFGVDGNNDGVRDPHNVYDAIPAAVRHLCPNGEITDLEAAIFAYNHSNDYVALVLEWSLTYTGAVSAIPIAGYAQPINAMTEALAIRPHHTYAATDLGVPVGTPTFAMVDGTVVTAIGGVGTYPGSGGKCGNTIVVEGVDSVRYTYCHLSAVIVTTDQTVVAGQQLGLTGGQPGAPGAGNTTGPHIHLSMRGGGRGLCPQPVMLSILLGTPINPLAAPSTGCISGQPNVDWVAWL